MDFKLTTLGTSAAGPVPGRWPSGQYLKTGKTGFLIDCGEGLQIALQRNGLGWGSIDVILISHLHGDHIYGLPGLLTSWGLNQRNTPLTIAGPPGLAPYLAAVFEHSHTGLPYPVKYTVVDPEQTPELVFEDKVVTVKTLPLSHRVPTVGYLIQEKPRPRTILSSAIQAYEIPYKDIPAIKAGGDYQEANGKLIPNAELTVDPPRARSFAYASDTCPNLELLPYIKGVDILFHEATFLNELKEQAKISGHSTAAQAAEVALAGEVKKLVLGHFSPRYGDLSPLLTEAQAIFPKTSLAKEGKVFDVPYGERISE
ncbi:MAG: ribonuclease Z [Lewinella sp.]|jgi:ribonuclease Z|uniref:ribonuclease Z n=1 Tax=Lewinella sp. TaxID=2004506 RepID=UPI003D6B7413